MVKFTEYKENKKIKPESGEHNGNTRNEQENMHALRELI